MSTDLTEKNWQLALIEAAKHVISGHEYWNERLENPRTVIHLAVLVEPYLRYILDGRKTVESRFSVNRCAPYHRVKQGDVILLKRAAGPVIGICEVSYVWYYELEPSSWQDIRETFTQALCAQDPTFWSQREAASVATLMRIGNVTEINPISCDKRDRRGWVVLTRHLDQLTIEEVDK